MCLHALLAVYVPFSQAYAEPTPQQRSSAWAPADTRREGKARTVQVLLEQARRWLFRHAWRSQPSPLLNQHFESSER